MLDKRRETRVRISCLHQKVVEGPNILDCADLVHAQHHVACLSGSECKTQLGVADGSPHRKTDLLMTITP
eukprot:2753574-Amphidinium_carterae.2